MPKLTKKSIEELSRILNVIPKEELDMYWGMYANDCFWRCVAYLNGAGTSEEAAATYALNYWSSELGSSVAAHAFLDSNGAGMWSDAAIAYVKANSIGHSIHRLDVDRLSVYMDNSISIGGAWHDVIFEISTTNDEGVDVWIFFDPQNGKRYTIPVSELLNGACKTIW